MKKLAIKLLLRIISPELENPGELDKEDREDGYIGLYENVKMIKNLQKILVEDTKEMLKDWSSKDKALMRAAMFARTFAIYDKARNLYNKAQQEIPTEYKK